MLPITLSAVDTSQPNLPPEMIPVPQVNQPEVSQENEENKWIKTLEYQERALKAQINRLGEIHPDIAISLTDIGISYEGLGLYDEALKNHMRALNIRRKVFEGGHRDIAASYNNVGICLKAMGKYGKAHENFREALKMRIAIFGENHLEVAKVHNNIGSCLAHLGRQQEALQCFNQALSLLDPSIMENRQHIVVMLYNKGSSLAALNRHEEARDNFSKALKIEQQVWKGLSPYQWAILDKSSRSWEALAQLDHALLGFETCVRMSCDPGYISFLQRSVNSLVNFLNRHPFFWTQPQIEELRKFLEKELGKDHLAVQQLTGPSSNPI